MLGIMGTAERGVVVHLAPWRVQRPAMRPLSPRWCVGLPGVAGTAADRNGVRGGTVPRTTSSSDPEPECLAARPGGQMGQAGRSLGWEG